MLSTRANLGKTKQEEAMSHSTSALYDPGLTMDDISSDYVMVMDSSLCVPDSLKQPAPPTCERCEKNEKDNKEWAWTWVDRLRVANACTKAAVLALKITTDILKK